MTAEQKPIFPPRASTRESLTVHWKIYGMFGGETVAYGPVKLTVEVREYRDSMPQEEHEFYLVDALEPGLDMIRRIIWLRTINL